MAPTTAVRPPTPAAQPTRPPARAVGRAPSGDTLGFLFFLVVNATLFVRPSEIIPELLGWQIYLVLILLCLAISFPGVLSRLAPRALVADPITVCVLGLLPAVLLSHLANFNFGGAVLNGFEFFKVVVYYLLFISLVNTPRRIRQFLFCFACFSVLLTLLAVLQYYGLITLANLKALKDHVIDPATGRDVVLRRLQSTGIFNDPNDLCLVLVVGVFLSLYWLGERRLGPARLLWLGPVGLFGYALALTYSKGGFLAFLAGLLVLLRARLGWARTVLAAAVILPVLFALYAGRQTSFSTEENTGQTRIQLWSDGLMSFRGSPAFGIGVDKFVEESGHAVHNSFLHGFTELGLFGGLLFLGAFVGALGGLYRLGHARDRIADPELRRLHPYLMAMVAGYAAGMLFLSLCYIIPTYLMLGLAAVYLRAAGATSPVPAPRFDFRFLQRVAVAGVLFLAATYVFVRVFVRWS
jgi:hypothetical protein